MGCITGHSFQYVPTVGVYTDLISSSRALLDETMSPTDGEICTYRRGIIGKCDGKSPSNTPRKKNLQPIFSPLLSLFAFLPLVMYSFCFPHSRKHNMP